ncbi:MAG: hypothetical protein AB2604_01550 [Candidatus Thiodiazotropha taylori]
MTPATMFVLLSTPKGPRRQAVANSILMHGLAPIAAEHSVTLSAISADQSTARLIKHEHRLVQQTEQSLQSEFKIELRQAKQQALAQGQQVCADAMLSVLASYIYQAYLDLDLLKTIEHVPGLCEDMRKLLQDLDDQRAALLDMPKLIESLVELIEAQRALDVNDRLSYDNLLQHELLCNLIKQVGLLDRVVEPDNET